MDREVFYRAERTLHAIKTKLLNNERIRQLLVLENPNDGSSPSLQVANDYVILQPLVGIATKQPYNKIGYIQITLSDALPSSTQDNLLDYSIKLVIQFDEEHVHFGNDEIRVLQLTQEIINELDNERFAFCNNLYFYSFHEMYIQNFAGCALLFGASDGTRG